MKTFSARTTIEASADAVWALLTDAPNYPTWNSTVEHVNGRIALGETLTIRVKAAPGQAFPVKVVEFQSPMKLVWAGGMPFGLFEGKRVFTLQSVASGIEFFMIETYTGLLAALITKSIPDLQPAFDSFAADLKTRAERG
jgi:uncharacterized protein YndB with AHSA1/START domain